MIASPNFEVSARPWLKIAAAIWICYARSRPVQFLVRLRARVDADCKYAAKTAELVRACTVEKELDPDDSIVASYETAEKALQDLYRTLRSKQDLARQAEELDGDNKEQIVAEYEQMIESVGELHDELEELRWAVMNHDGRVSGVAATITSDSELDGFFKSL
jgi:hypothetical protein